MNWPPLSDSKADVSSVSPSSERIKELWVVCSLYTLLVEVGAWQREKQLNKLVE